MTKPYTLSAIKAIIRQNATCIYCGAQFSSSLPATKEHVIGRRFVPKGTLNVSWNLIVRACQACNNRKADLEDDISAILMQPDAFGCYACNDPRLIETGKRKAIKSFSRRTKKLISSSNEELKINLPFFGSNTISFSLTSPPQLDDQRVLDLCSLHIRAFFYLITYDSATKMGRFASGEFVLAADAKKADWGNVRLLDFERQTKNWDVRFHGVGADEFFKVWIRKRKEEVPLWAWALEWNKSFRAVGYFGDERLVTEFTNALSNYNFEVHQCDSDQMIRTRVEVQIPAEQEDSLFIYI